MPTISLDSNPSKPSYLSYHVESDPSEPSHPSVIHLTSDLSSSFAVSRHVPPRFVVVGSFIPTPCPVDVGVLEEKDVVISHLGVLGMVSSHHMSDAMIVCRVEHEDSPFFVIVIGLSFYCMACLGFRDF